MNSTVIVILFAVVMDGCLGAPPAVDVHGHRVSVQAPEPVISLSGAPLAMMPSCCIDGDIEFVERIWPICPYWCSAQPLRSEPIRARPTVPHEREARLYD